MSLIKTKVYLAEQVGVLDDGTRRIARGKLLYGNQTTLPPRPPLNTVSNKDLDGDTQITGVNKTRPIWVYKNELDRCKAEAICIRCGTKIHIISKCRFLTAQYRQITS